MKPATTTDKTVISEQAIKIIEGCSNWSDIRYRILPKIETLISERESLRAAIEVAIHNLNAGNDTKFLADYLRLTLDQKERSE